MPGIEDYPSYQGRMLNDTNDKEIRGKNMVVAHNLLAMNSQRQLSLISGTVSKKVQKLSSGYRINKAADDAAGLAMS